MSTLELGGPEPLSPPRLAEAARAGHAVRLHPDALARIRAAHDVVRRAAAAGVPVYGVTTGLGAVMDTAIDPDDAGLQRRVILARAVGVGGGGGGGGGMTGGGSEDATDIEVRAIMIARLAGLARGVSGASELTVQAYLAMLEAGIHPLVPCTGSVGEADLAPLAHIAAVLIGEGTARVPGGATLVGAAALAGAGLQPATLAPKDGLALVSSNAASAGLGALALAQARHAMAALTAAAALSLEAQRAHPGLLRADIVALHPAPGQDRVAAELRRQLDGGALAAAGAGRRLHDPLSFRCAVPVLGSLLASLDAAHDALALQLDSSDDNPAVLADTITGTASFDTTHLALAFETLGQAMSRAATLTGARIMQLMRTETTGLPRFLTTRGGTGRSGLAPLQKTVAALVAAIAHQSLPMPATVLAAADGLEDYATMSVPIMRKTGAIARMLALLASAEMLTAAQAIDLRPAHRLGRGTSAQHAAIRSIVAPLDEDRSLAADLHRLDAALREAALPETAAALSATAVARSGGLA